MSSFRSLSFMSIFAIASTHNPAPRPSIEASNSNRIQTGYLACFGILTLLALSGCAAVQVKLGMKVYLAKTPVTSIEVVQSNGPGIGPGQKASLIVTVTQPDGKMLQTEGAGQGKVMWSDLAVTATNATVNKKGALTLPRDPRKSEGKFPHISIAVPSHPEVQAASLDIPLRYNYSFASGFFGSTGFGGTNGTNGIDGSSGTPGSIDPNNPSPGGNGSDGSNGSDGTDGGRGGDGPPVQVLLTLRPGPHPLIQAKVSTAGHNRFYLIDPQGGSLTVGSVGGSGGSGGKGGHGGRGGSGGIGTPNGSSGSDGSGGRDGSDGQSGSGGAIAVTYDPQVQPYLAILHLNNPGGPRPTFIEQPVASLW